MPKKEDFDFKKAIEELETINDWFSGEDIDLDEGLEKLKRGKELVLACQKRLDEAETEFIAIKQDMSQNDDQVLLQEYQD